MASVEEMKYRYIAWQGRVLAGLKINEVHKTNLDQQTFYSKRRRWFAQLSVVIGNLYLKRIGASTQFRQNHQWHLWELEIYRAVYGIHLAIDAKRWLLIPEWPGTVLASYLESEVHSDSEKLQAIRLATRSLSQLHAVEVRWPDGQKRPLSHGDATVENVILGDSPLKASWFDFDMIHEQDRDTRWRHADDLRAFAYSAAGRLRAAMYPELSRVIADGYPDTDGVEALAESVSHWRRRPISFHLAQARLNYRERQRLDDAILEAVRCRVHTAG